MPCDDPMRTDSIRSYKLLILNRNLKINKVYQYPITYNASFNQVCLNHKFKIQHPYKAHSFTGINVATREYARDYTRAL